ncbi:MAG: 4'-phosphopantetheinyl transferase superfamily protein [Rhodoblastus sp.]|nr:4'-phosphopantetheinyl transferase superfamily protein [Rhodoblastus sp.]
MAVRRRSRRRPIEPLAQSFDYPGGRADIWLARLGDPAHDLAPARAALARELIARRARCAADDVVLDRDPRGAPRIAAPATALRLSLAGRDDVVAAAVAGDPIGVDVEVIAAPFEPPLHVLHPAERAVLETAGQGAYEIFLLLWTAKEAYVKALGAGLAREPREIEIRLAGAGGCGAFEVFDCGRRVPAALAWTGRALVRQRPVMLACFVAGR